LSLSFATQEKNHKTTMSQKACCRLLQPKAKNHKMTMSHEAHCRLLQPKKKSHKMTMNLPICLSLLSSSTIQEKKKHKRQRLAMRLVVIFCKYKKLSSPLLNAHTHIDKGVVIPSNFSSKASNSGVQGEGPSL
jgi:hypothetical protein